MVLISSRRLVSRDTTLVDIGICTHALMTGIAKCSPDAYVQMALQLAYYKQNGKNCPTYETAGTRKFSHGRTAATRTLSVDSVAFCNTMENPEADVSTPNACSNCCRWHVLIPLNMLNNIGSYEI